MNLIKETLSLSLEEAFFLSFALGCLIVKDLNDIQLTVTAMWQKFSRAEANFIVNYVAYHYYRSKGWTVKSGLKYGGDYLLYKRGPAYYHASYLVQVVDGKKKFSWNELIGMNRLVETFNKVKRKKNRNFGESLIFFFFFRICCYVTLSAPKN